MTSVSTSSEVKGAAEPSSTPTVNNTGRNQTDAILEELPARQPSIPIEKWLLRGRAPENGQPVVLASQTALLQMAAHSASDLDVELGGALLGKAYRHQGRVVVQVMAALPAVNQDHGPVHFHFSADSWKTLQHDRDTHYADLDIIGWFHTHPDLGVFYSGDDVVVHSAAFTLPWHVGLVIDPVRNEACFFGWVEGELTPLAGFYELPDRQAEPVVKWQVVKTAVWDNPYRSPDGSTAYLQPGASHVLMPHNSLPAPSRWLGLVLGGGALLLSFFLLAGLVALNRQNDRLEQVALVLAHESLRDSNAFTCPDPRLRIIVPLLGSNIPAGSELAFVGTADYPDAVRYQLDMRPAETEPWTLLGRFRRDQTLGELGTWDTAGATPGQYEVRLSAVDRNNIRLGNSPPCAIQLNITS
jgi:proteasome lid subunit RPN8/RPN11